MNLKKIFLDTIEIGKSVTKPVGRIGDGKSKSHYDELKRLLEEKDFPLLTGISNTIAVAESDNELPTVSLYKTEKEILQGKIREKIAWMQSILVHCGVSYEDINLINKNQ